MDTDRFKRLFLGFHPKLYWVAFALTGSGADAEDLVQEVYVRLWRKRKALGGVRNPEAFAVTMTRRVCLDFLRSPAGRRNQELPPSLPGEEPERNMAAADLLERVHALIDRLPEKQRQVLRLSAIEELTPEETAGLTGLSPGHIRTLLSRARKTLREQLNGER